ncbi:hypothetical protein [Granulicella sp. L60]|uniref:hypothetical protein n=1 Tax=Granulicella sp. L60 TaxID=1641866 RepID=UPI00131E7206
MALGARRASILTLIAWDGLRMVLAGGVLGLAAARCRQRDRMAQMNPGGRGSSGRAALSVLY